MISGAFGNICTILVSIIFFILPAQGEIIKPIAHTPKGLAPDLNLTPYQTPAIIKINEAKQAYFEEQYGDACDLWREALTLSPRQPAGIWHDIGLCSEKQQKYTDAINALTEAIQYRKSPDFYAFRGEMYFKNGDWDLAQADFEQFFTMKQLNPDKSYRTMARLFQEEENYQQSLNYAEQGIEKLNDINRLFLMVTKAGNLGALGKVDEGIRFLEENKDMFNISGDSKDIKNAKEYYHSTFIFLCKLKIKEAIKNKNKEQAITYLKKVNEVDQQDKAVNEALCHLLFQSGEVTESWTYCGKNNSGYYWGYQLGSWFRNLFE